MFDSWVSLGYRCEVAFQFRRVLGRDVSSFFAWNVTPVASLLSLLQSDFAGILEPDNLSWNPENGLILDASHGHSLHADFSTREPRDDPDFAARLDLLKQKTDHFLNKIRNPLGRVCYFYLCETDIDPEQVQGLRWQLDRLGPCELVVMRHESFRDQPLNVVGVHDRFMERLAPLGDMTDGHVRSWDRIFAEFPLAGQDMRLSGF